ncbi:MAG: glycosyltransferase [Deltaproteobacteria bacterium]|nr:glycosyltransferase [Deltaproteobacteria bacterium]
MTVDRKIVLHDSFAFLGGGERVAMALAKDFHAELWTGQLDKGSFFEGCFDGLKLRSLDAYKTSPRVLGFSQILQLWWAFAHLPKVATSWAVFSGSFSPLAYKKIAGRKIFYCHTPPRVLYDQRSFMVRQLPPWQRPFLRGVMVLYRLAYERAVRGMNTIVTNSETVRKRLRKFLGHDSLVVYPPCETGRFRWIEEGNYFLSTARVDPLKRVALIVEAFMKMPDKRLVVISGGSDMPRIREMAGRVENIDVLGWVDDEKLCDLMGRCIATIYIPRDEDFGISPVESMAAGKPVIGVQEGALLETVGRERGAGSKAQGAGGGGQRSPRLNTLEGDPVQRGKEVGDRRAEAGREMMITDCGVLVTRDPGIEDIVEAVEWMTPERAIRMRGACEARASRFDISIFLEKMKNVIEGEG